MKTIIDLQIHEYNSEISQFARLVANCNKGLSSVTMNDVMGYCNVQSALFPSLPITFNQNQNVLKISTNEGLFATLTWKEINELDKGVIQIAEDKYPDLQNHSSLIVTPS